MNGVDMLTTVLAFLFLLCCFMAWERNRRDRDLEREMRELRDQARREMRRRQLYSYYHGADLHDDSLEDAA